MSEVHPPLRVSEVVWANKAALSLGAVGSLLIIVIPACIWFATVAAKVEQLGSQQQTTWSRIDSLNQARSEDMNRITRLETIIPLINDQLTDIKKSVEKIETRVVK